MSNAADKNGGHRIDVKSLRSKLGASRAALGKLLGAHPNSIALWESGKTVGPKFLGKLRELEASAAKGEVAVPARKKGGRPKGSKNAPAEKRSRKRGASGTFPVKALRLRIGASQGAFAKLLGVSLPSIFNWERGKSISEDNLTKLHELEKKAATGEVKLPERNRGGRPRKTGEVSRERSSKAAISGIGVLHYANVLQIVEGAGESVVRFGLMVPGQGTRAVADVVVPNNILQRLR